MLKEGREEGRKGEGIKEGRKEGKEGRKGRKEGKEVRYVEPSPTAQQLRSSPCMRDLI
jgi:hypothetical protein